MTQCTPQATRIREKRDAVGPQIRRHLLGPLVNGGRCPGGPPPFGTSAA